MKLGFLFSRYFRAPSLSVLLQLEEHEEAKICALHWLVLKYDNDFWSKISRTQTLVRTSNKPSSKPYVSSQLGIPVLKSTLSFQSVIIIVRIFSTFSVL